VLVEECDSFDVKILLRSPVRALGILVVMETSDRGMIDVVTTGWTASEFALLSLPRHDDGLDLVSDPRTGSPRRCMT
jgi:hypothetical protein